LGGDDVIVIWPPYHGFSSERGAKRRSPRSARRW